VTQQRLRRHANQCHGSVDAVLARPKDNMTTMDAVHTLGLLFEDWGKLDKAEEMFKRALRGYEKPLGRVHTSTLQTVNNLGVFYRNQGKLDKAEEMYEQALQGGEKSLGRNHSATLGTVNNLGTLYADQGKLDKAEEMYKRALQGREKALGRDHTSTLQTVNNLGILYRHKSMRVWVTRLALATTVLIVTTHVALLLHLGIVL
jgi:tetratricopeptide (TPR) repeat protein